MLRWLIIILATITISAQELHLQVVTTTNLNGHILPEDSYTLQPVNQGWAKLATIIRKLRLANPNTIVIDCGDATQGEPVNYIWSHLKSQLPEPSMTIMNALKYDAMLIGSCELNQGLKHLHLIEHQAKFPWLSANIVPTTNNKAFTPYVLISVKDVRIAILGLTTLSQPKSIQLDISKDLIFQDPVTTARSLVPILKNKEKADMIILALYCGPGTEDYIKGLESEIDRITYNFIYLK